MLTETATAAVARICRRLEGNPLAIELTAARIELGDLATGTHEVERALALNPKNAYAAHARAHGYYEAGDAAGGAGFIESWLPGYDRRSQLHGHLSWHQALCDLALGNAERARTLYAEAIRPAVSHAPPLFNLADSASFLWRWQVYGESPPLDGEWQEITAHVQRFFPGAGMHFADIHAILGRGPPGVHREADVALRDVQF